MSTIQKTQDYKQFKYFDCNRTINPTLLVPPIKAKNMLHNHPIVVTKEKYVIDGQHRLEAAKFLGVPIYYVVDEDLTEHDIPMINANQKAWQIKDFLGFYVKQGKPVYLFIEKASTYFKLPVHFIISCLKKSKEAFKDFRKGTLTFCDEGENFDYDEYWKEFEKFDECYKLCLTICDKKSEYLSFESMRTLWCFMQRENYNHEIFMRKCATWRDKVKEAFSFRTKKYIMEGLERLYNMKSKINYI